MNYGNILYNLRIENGLSQTDLSKVLKIDHSIYSHYELENQIIPIKHLITLSQYYNVSIDFIFGLSSKKNYCSIAMDINKKVVGQRLKEFRKKQNLTQKDLAKYLNCSNTTLAGYESGRYLIATPFLYTICQKYKISADYLLGKIYEPEYLE